MTETVKLNELRDLLETLEYPLDKADAIDAVEGVTLQYADGTEALSAVVDRSMVGTFASVDDLTSEVFTHVPTEAVGEPGQAEGEG